MKTQEYILAIEELLINHHEEIDGLLLSSSNLELLGLDFQRMALPPIYNIRGVQDSRTDQGPFLLSCLDKDESTIAHYLICHRMESGTIEAFQLEGGLLKFKVMMFGAPYFSLNTQKDKTDNIKDVFETLLSKYKLNAIWVDDHHLPLPIYNILKDLHLEIRPGVQSRIEDIRISIPLSFEETMEYKKATEIAQQAFDALKEDIEALNLEDSITESEIDSRINDIVAANPRARLIHRFVQTSGLYPRTCVHQEDYKLSAESPLLKCDIGVLLKKGQSVGVADISRTFFFPEQHVSKNPEVQTRYQHTKHLYDASISLVKHLQNTVKIGDSGEDIFASASLFFSETIIPDLLEKGVINAPIELNRNVGHWIRDYVEGQPFYKGTHQRLKENDVICIECPIGTEECNITVNYELEGRMTPDGFVSFN